MASVTKMTVDGQSASSANTLRRWMSFLQGKNRQLALKSRPTLTESKHSRRLQQILKKRTATNLMLSKPPTKQRQPIKRKFDAIDNSTDDAGNLPAASPSPRKIRRVNSPETKRILKKLAAVAGTTSKYGEDTAEDLDLTILFWRSACQHLGLWPIFSIDIAFPKLRGDFFFNAPVAIGNDFDPRYIFEFGDPMRSIEYLGTDGEVDRRHTQEMQDVISEADFLFEDPTDEHGDLIEMAQITMIPHAVPNPLNHFDDSCDLDLIEYSPRRPLLDTEMEGYTPQPSSTFNNNTKAHDSEQHPQKVSPAVQLLMEGIQGGSSEDQVTSKVSSQDDVVPYSPLSGRKGIDRNSPYARPSKDTKAPKFKSQLEIIQIIDSWTIPSDLGNVPSIEQNESINPATPEPTPEAAPEASQGVTSEASTPSELIVPQSPSEPQVATDDFDDSGYVSDDGLEQAVAEAAEEIEIEKAKAERERRACPWKPRQSSSLKNELHPDDIPDTVRPKITGRWEYMPDDEDKKAFFAHLALVRHLSTRNFNSNGKQIYNKHCNIGDHHTRSFCRCRSTATARAILQIGDGHLTPERICRATCEQLRLLRHVEHTLSDEERLELKTAILQARIDLEKLEYGVDYLCSGVPGLADLSVHAEKIHEKYQLEQERHQRAKRAKQLAVDPRATRPSLWRPPTTPLSGKRTPEIPTREGLARLEAQVLSLKRFLI